MMLAQQVVCDCPACSKVMVTDMDAQSCVCLAGHRVYVAKFTKEQVKAAWQQRLMMLALVEEHFDSIEDGKPHNIQGPRLLKRIGWSKTRRTEWEAIGVIVHTARIARGLSQAQLSRELNGYIDANAISGIERSLATPRIELARLLDGILGTELVGMVEV
jgi:ribosome-binding protein aMBF1 (putative translation factor)